MGVRTITVGLALSCTVSLTVNVFFISTVENFRNLGEAKVCNLRVYSVFTDLTSQKKQRLQCHIYYIL
jgi:hypothetical protein